MNSTPNYEYSCEALYQIDRDIKRVEDKADLNSAQKVDKQEGCGLIFEKERNQIWINKENIKKPIPRLR